VGYVNLLGYNGLPDLNGLTPHYIREFNIQPLLATLVVHPLTRWIFDFIFQYPSLRDIPFLRFAYKVYSYTTELKEGRVDRIAKGLILPPRLLMERKKFLNAEEDQKKREDIEELEADLLSSQRVQARIRTARQSAQNGGWRAIPRRIFWALNDWRYAILIFLMARIPWMRTIRFNYVKGRIDGLEKGIKSHHYTEELKRTNALVDNLHRHARNSPGDTFHVGGFASETSVVLELSRNSIEANRFLRDADPNVRTGEGGFRPSRDRLRRQRALESQETDTASAERRHRALTFVSKAIKQLTSLKLPLGMSDNARILEHVLIQTGSHPDFAEDWALGLIKHVFSTNEVDVTRWDDALNLLYINRLIDDDHYDLIRVKMENQEGVEVDVNKSLRRQVMRQLHMLTIDGLQLRLTALKNDPGDNSARIAEHEKALRQGLVKPGSAAAPEGTVTLKGDSTLSRTADIVPAGLWHNEIPIVERAFLDQLRRYVESRFDLGIPVYSEQDLKRVLLRRAARAYGQNSEDYTRFQAMISRVGELMDGEYTEFDTQDVTPEQIRDMILLTNEVMPVIAESFRVGVQLVADLEDEEGKLKEDTAKSITDRVERVSKFISGVTGQLWDGETYFNLLGLNSENTSTEDIQGASDELLLNYDTRIINGLEPEYDVIDPLTLGRLTQEIPLEDLPLGSQERLDLTIFKQVHPDDQIIDSEFVARVRWILSTIRDQERKKQFGRRSLLHHVLLAANVDNVPNKYLRRFRRLQRYLARLKGVRFRGPKARRFMAWMNAIERRNLIGKLVRGAQTSGHLDPEWINEGAWRSHRDLVNLIRNVPDHHLIGIKEKEAKWFKELRGQIGDKDLNEDHPNYTSILHPKAFDNKWALGPKNLIRARKTLVEIRKNIQEARDTIGDTMVRPAFEERLSLDRRRWEGTRRRIQEFHKRLRKVPQWVEILDKGKRIDLPLQGLLPYYLPALRLVEQVVPGKLVQVVKDPDQPGQFLLSVPEDLYPTVRNIIASTPLGKELVRWEQIFIEQNGYNPRYLPPTALGIQEQYETQGLGWLRARKSANLDKYLQKRQSETERLRYTDPAYVSSDDATLQRWIQVLDPEWISTMDESLATIPEKNRDKVEFPDMFKPDDMGEELERLGNLPDDQSYKPVERDYINYVVQLLWLREENGENLNSNGSPTTLLHTLVRATAFHTLPEENLAGDTVLLAKDRAWIISVQNRPATELRFWERWRILHLMRQIHMRQPLASGVENLANLTIFAVRWNQLSNGDKLKDAQLFEQRDISLLVDDLPETVPQVAFFHKFNQMIDFALSPFATTLDGKTIEDKGTGELVLNPFPSMADLMEMIRLRNSGFLWWFSLWFNLAWGWSSSRSGVPFMAWLWNWRPLELARAWLGTTPGFFDYIRRLVKTYSEGGDFFRRVHRIVSSQVRQGVDAVARLLVKSRALGLLAGVLQSSPDLKWGRVQHIRLRTWTRRSQSSSGLGQLDLGIEERMDVENWQLTRQYAPDPPGVVGRENQERILSELSNDLINNPMTGYMATLPEPKRAPGQPEVSSTRVQLFVYRPGYEGEDLKHLLAVIDALPEGSDLLVPEYFKRTVEDHPIFHETDSEGEVVERASNDGRSYLARLVERHDHTDLIEKYNLNQKPTHHTTTHPPKEIKQSPSQLNSPDSNEEE